MHPGLRQIRQASTGRVLLPIILILFMVLFNITHLSCGSDETKKPEVNPPSQEQNAQSLGRIMGHRNQLEGELNEPVDAVIAGDVTAVAESGEETWVLVKVVDFRVEGAQPDALKASPGSELSVRLRVAGGAEAPAAGDSVEINAMISKSLEGPVIIGRAFRVIE